MAAVKRMKQAFNLCSSSEAISDKEKDYLHFYCAVRSILFKLTKGDAPDISQMNARVRELLEGAIQSDGIEELFETGKHISVDIFSDDMFDAALRNTRIEMSPAERRQFYEKHIRHMTLTIDENGNVSIELNNFSMGVSRSNTRPARSPHLP